MTSNYRLKTSRTGALHSVQRVSDALAIQTMRRSHHGDMTPAQAWFFGLCVGIVLLCIISI